MTSIQTAAKTVTGVLDRALVISRLKKKEEVRTYADLKDEALISLVQKGEIDAYSQVLSRYQGKIFSYVMRLINNREEADDITQQVFFKAYKGIHGFDTQRKFSSWLYRIAHNESVNWLKKKTKIKMESLEQQVENTGLQIAEKRDVHAELVKKEEQELIRQAIADLPEKYQEVMEMRYLDQLSYEEISEKIDRPVNTVGTLINRAKKRLAINLEIHAPDHS